MLEAFDTLINKPDFAAAERFWSERYIPLRTSENWAAGFGLAQQF
jgi:hypothetical protein